MEMHVTYYTGSTAYPHPTKPDKWLVYIRNRPTWRLVIPLRLVPVIKPYDIYQDKAGTIWCKNALGKQKKFADMFGIDVIEVFRDVEILP